MFKSFALILLLCSLVFGQDASLTMPAADGNVQKQLFPGPDDEQKFNDAVQRLFQRFDADGNGVITDSDLQTVFHTDSIVGAFSSLGQKVATAFSQEFGKFDTNGDGRIDETELNAGLQPLKDFKYNVIDEKCVLAKQARRQCRSELKAHVGLSGDDDSVYRDVRTVETLCLAGVSALNGYVLEQCLIDQPGCQEKIDCFIQTAQVRSSEPTLQKRSVVELKKRTEAPDVFRAAFWGALILLSVAVLPTVLFVPFYLLVLAAAYNTIDWSTVDNKVVGSE